MTQEQAEKVSRDRMTAEKWCVSQGIDAAKLDAIHRTDRAAIPMLALDVMRAEALKRRYNEMTEKLQALDAEMTALAESKRRLDAIKASLTQD